MLVLAAVGAYPQAAQIDVQATLVEVGFSPGGTALALVEKAISAAQSEVLMACYEFTSRDIAEALEAAAHRGVKVRIVADWKAAHDRFSQVPALLDAGIPVRLDRLTGSFNYTTAADRHNAENALVLWHESEIARVYAAEWNRLWDESRG